jgi:hypothetical protein
MPLDPIELEQLRLYEELGADASVAEMVGHALGLEDAETLVVRQLVSADANVDQYVAQLRSVRRAAVGCGFVAGVTFAESVRRAQGAK